MGIPTQFRYLALFLPIILVAAGKPSHKLLSIRVDPAQITLTGTWSAQQILVTGTYSDGSLHDVTTQATFKSAAPKIAAVSPTGIVTPMTDGKTLIAISVKGARKIKASVTVKASREIAA